MAKKNNAMPVKMTKTPTASSLVRDFIKHLRTSPQSTQNQNLKHIVKNTPRFAWSTSQCLPMLEHRHSPDIRQSKYKLNAKTKLLIMVPLKIFFIELDAALHTTPKGPSSTPRKSTPTILPPIMPTAAKIMESIGRLSQFLPINVVTQYA